MKHNRRIVQDLYRKLLALYPPEFRELLEESMEKSFQDLYNEKQQTQKGLSYFLLWIFAETWIGIAREYLQLIREGEPMKSILTSLKSPAMISFILMIPFMIMELVNRQNYQESFPFPLFFILWLLSMLFIVILMPVVRNVRMGNSLMAHPLHLALRVALLVFIAGLWTSILVDQMPCFMGIPNCD